MKHLHRTSLRSVYSVIHCNSGIVGDNVNSNDGNGYDELVALWDYYNYNHYKNNKNNDDK